MPGVFRYFGQAEIVVVTMNKWPFKAMGAIIRPFERASEDLKRRREDQTQSDSCSKFLQAKNNKTKNTLSISLRHERDSALLKHISIFWDILEKTSSVNLREESLS